MNKIVQEMIDDMRDLQEMHDVYLHPECEYEYIETAIYQTYQTCIDIVTELGAKLR